MNKRSIRKLFSSVTSAVTVIAWQSLLTPRRIQARRQEEEKWQKILRLDPSSRCLWGRRSVSRWGMVTVTRGNKHFVPGSTHLAPRKRTYEAEAQLSDPSHKATDGEASAIWCEVTTCFPKPLNSSCIDLGLSVGLEQVCPYVESRAGSTIRGTSGVITSYATSAQNHLTRLKPSPELLLTKPHVGSLAARVCKSQKVSLRVGVTVPGSSFGPELIIRQVLKLHLWRYPQKILYLQL